ncbi:hypothetical protein ARMSODRAFT_1087193 [Armillaria solidipes]|uniref:Uncharacterized protein n=1 Tax=Armillaria solidipes TaxID=1076256 RepID=A0A2H3B509_9AGAR|nr:hypothetical protein ARMSODRAFT_1087193 [Armillaria solidipes]
MSPPPQPCPRLVIDPHLIPCPDFAAADYAFICDALKSANNLSNDDAVARLTQDWTTRNAKDRDIWDAQTRADQDAVDLAKKKMEQATADARIVLEKEKETEKKEKDKKRPKLGNFDPLLKVVKEADPILHPYAQKQLSDYKYCPLWYFTKMSATEASTIVNTLAPDTLNLQQDSGSGSLSFQASSTIKPSKNALADKDLSWSQFSYAYAWFLRAIDAANWPKPTIQMFASMFLSLTLHACRKTGDQFVSSIYMRGVEPIVLRLAELCKRMRMYTTNLLYFSYFFFLNQQARQDAGLPYSNNAFRQRANGEKTLLVYADDTRRQWHRDIEEGNCAPNLATIVPERLENISNELYDKSKGSITKVRLLFWV